MTKYFTNRFRLSAVAIATIVLLAVIVRNWLESASDRNTLINEVEQLGAWVKDVNNTSSVRQQPPTSLEKQLHSVVGKRSFDGPLHITIRADETELRGDGPMQPRALDKSKAHRKYPRQEEDRGRNAAYRRNLVRIAPVGNDHHAQHRDRDGREICVPRTTGTCKRDCSCSLVRHVRILHRARII